MKVFHVVIEYPSNTEQILYELKKLEETDLICGSTLAVLRQIREQIKED